MLAYRHTVFLHVAENLSFSKAAEQLFISQPAVSKHIQLLESQYHLSLFDRGGSSIELTQAGRVLLNYLTKAREIQRDLQFEMGQLEEASSSKGDLILGASTTVALYMVPEVLSGFSKQYPNLKIRLVNRNSQNILKALESHEIDLGIVEARGKKRTIRYEPFISDQVVAVCSTTSPLASKTHYSLEELVNLPVALREQGSGTLVALQSTLNTYGINLKELKVVIRLGGTEALKNFVLADECLGFLPYRSVVKEIRRGDLVLLEIGDLSISRQFYFIQRQGNSSDPLNMAFIRFAKLHHNNLL